MTRLRRWMRAAAAMAVLAVCAMLIWQCIDIYLTGNAPTNLDADGQHIEAVYSRTEVAERLERLALPLGSCAAVIAAAVLLHWGTGEMLPRHALTAENRLRLMQRRMGSLPADAARELRRMRWIRLTAAAVICVCGAMCAAASLALLGDLLADPQIALRNLDGDVGGLVLRLLPWVSAGLLAAAVAAVLCDRSRLRACDALRGLPAGAVRPRRTERSRARGTLRIALYAAAVVFIVLGVMNGGALGVMRKAVAICMECIGLG